MSSYADMSPEARQDLAACNAGTYAMSAADRDRWFAEHPVSDYTDEAMAPLLDREARIDQKLIRNQLHPERSN